MILPLHFSKVKYFKLIFGKFTTIWLPGQDSGVETK